MHTAKNVFCFGLIFLFGFCLTGCGSKAEPTATGDKPLTKEASDDAHPTVVIKTSLGDLTVELDVQNAPITAESFLNYAGKKQYDGTIFHQVDAGYMALGGGYDRDLKLREPAFAIRNEAHHGQKNLRGTIAMARDADAIDSATNQFFFNLADNAPLDHTDRTPAGYGYCAFGKVTEGHDVLDKISAAAVQDRDDFVHVPVEPIVIESVRRIR